MKKSYLMIAAAAALFAACSDNDTFKEINNTEGPAINFSTYAQKATRAENSDENYTLNLEDHHLSFKVWGYKNTTATPVFDGEEVGYTNSAWGYTNTRYWDKAATHYYYYACAPYDANTPFVFNGFTPAPANATAEQIATSISSQNAGYFTITSSYNKAGDNISPKNSTTAQTSWKGAKTSGTENATTDVDLMIADVCHLTGAQLTWGIVQLNFIHILSRLNVTLKYSDDFATANTNNDIITVNNITIGHMKNAGTFDESTVPTVGTLAAGTNERWTADGNNDYSYDIDYDVTDDANYVIEALMIPQTAALEEISLDGTKVIAGTETSPYLYINYTIWNADKSKGETFEVYYNLATVFKITGTNVLAFNEGWQNTLNITMDPKIISFDANVAPWDENENEDLTVIE